MGARVRVAASRHTRDLANAILFDRYPAAEGGIRQEPEPDIGRST